MSWTNTSKQSSTFTNVATSSSTTPSFKVGIAKVGRSKVGDATGSIITTQWSNVIIN